MKPLACALIAASIMWACAPARAQDKPDTTKSKPGASTKPGTDAKTGAQGESANAVVATVNNEPITEEEFDELFETVVTRQTRGQPVPDQIRAQFRKQLKPKLVETLIDDHLLTASAQKAGVSVTEDQLRSEMEKDISAYLVRSGITRDEFSQQIKRAKDESIEAFVADRIKQPDYKRNMLHVALLEKKYPDELKVSEDDIKARYKRDAERVYTRPEKVRASHILVTSKPGDPPEKREAALKRAQEILAKAKKPDADFAALAKENSDGPSKSTGGDLGFFPRKGAMVEPFAAAAFKLQPGQLSDIVETQFGFHIIRVTDRKPAVVVTLEDAKPAIARELRAEKIASLRSKLVEELRKSAKIEYPKDATG